MRFENQTIIQVRGIDMIALSLQLFYFIDMIALDNPMLLLLPAFVAVLAIFLVWSVLELSAKKEKKQYHPTRSTAFHLLLHFKRLHDYFTDLARRNKTFRILLPGNIGVYTTDPVVVEHILKTNFANYGKGALHHDILKDLLGDGIFTIDGERWLHQRKMSSYEFSTRNLGEFSNGIFRCNACKLAHIVSAAVAADQTIDIQDLLLKSTSDSVFKVVLGIDLDSVCGTNEVGLKFSNAFDRASELTIYRYMDLFWRVKKILNIGTEAVLKKYVKVVHQFVDDVIQSKIQQIRNPSQELPVNKGDILSRFIKTNETDPKYLKDIMLSFIVAGRDTTAIALSWFLYMMCKHPLLQEKIVQEVKMAAKLEESSSIEVIAESITEEALIKMHFLHAALTETLRLYPPVPQDGKECFSDDTFPDGFHVKKGHMVFYGPYAMGRMKSLWGEDADEFRPERWLDDNGTFRQESSFKFTTFQAGPRICIGKDFAYRQMKVFAAILLSAFSFKMMDGSKQVKYRTMLTLQIDGGLHVRASYRMNY